MIVSEYLRTEIVPEILRKCFLRLQVVSIMEGGRVELRTGKSVASQNSFHFLFIISR